MKERDKDLLSEQENELLNGGNSNIRWYHYIIHLGYYIGYWIKFFFSKPFKEPKAEINVLDQIQALIESGTSKENIEMCEELSHLHRIIENTKARKRLEKWSLRVIAIYLMVVLLLVVANYYIKVMPIGVYIEPIPTNIMITILSTTTVNIIGLGLIVLRGHFLSKESMEDNGRK